MVSTSFALFIVAWNVIYWSIAGGCSSWWNTNAGGIKTANCRKTGQAASVEGEIGSHFSSRVLHQSC